LDLDRAVHGVNDAAELDDAAIAGSFDDEAVMSGHGWINEIAALAAQA
jgi:hypothetical protein